jgi:hypothetical protein
MMSLKAPFRELQLVPHCVADEVIATHAIRQGTAQRCSIEKWKLVSPNKAPHFATNYPVELFTFAIDYGKGKITNRRCD